MKSLAIAIVGGDENRADDLFQEAMLAALEKPPKPGIPFRAWITGVMKKLHLFRARTDSRRVRRESIAAQYALAGSSFPPDIVVQQESERKRVIDAVLSLEDPERSAILFRFYDKLTISQIAERTNVAEKTVKRRINRSLHKLSRQLDEEHGGDGRSWKLAIAPIAGISLSELAAAETTFIAASIAAKGAGVGLGAWLKGAAALILVVGVSLTVLHLVDSDETNDTVDPSPAAKENSSPAIPGRLNESGDQSTESMSSDRLEVSDNNERIPIESGRIPFSVKVVNRLDPDRPVGDYHLSLKREIARGDTDRFGFETDVNEPDGFYATSLPWGGSYLLEIRSEKYCPYTASQLYISPTEGLTDFEIKLDPGVTIVGRIVDHESGAPVEDVIVADCSLNGSIFEEIESGMPWGWTKTDGTGNFELKGLTQSKNSVALLAIHPEYAPEEFRAGPLDRTVEATLKRGFRISGQVKDNNGVPTDDVIMMVNEIGKTSINRPVSFDENGRYETAPLRPGRIVLKVYSKPPSDVFSSESQVVHLTHSDQQGIDFGPSEDRCTWAGRLLLGAHPWDAGATLSLLPCAAGKENLSRTAKCDSEGRFTFRKIGLGEYRVAVAFPSGQWIDEIVKIRFDHAGHVGRDIELRGGFVVGRIVTERQTATLISSFITLNRIGDDPLSIAIRPDSAGEFNLVAVPPGEYSINLDLQFSSIDKVSNGMCYDVLDETGQLRTIQVVDGQIQELVIPLVPAGSILLEGKGFDFSDLRFLDVEITDSEGSHHGLLRTRQWSDGSWAAYGVLQPGSWKAKLSFQNIGHEEIDFQVAARRETKLIVEKGQLKPHEWLKSVAGSLTNRDGEPLAGRSLTFSCIETESRDERYWYTLRVQISLYAQSGCFR